MSTSHADRIALLQSIPYLSILDKGTLHALAHAARTCQYPAGAVILVEGDPCPGLWIVESGRVKASLLSPSGREHILAIYGPGEVLNEMSAFDSASSAVTLQTLAETHLLVISCPVFQNLLDEHPEVAREALKQLASRSRRLVATIADLSLRTVTARLAGLLLDSVTGSGDATMTRSQMAARLGTVREVVSRSLRDLERLGLIRIERDRIVLLKPRELARLAERE
ncbi:MAG: Crp/Fnr family transcriptional regulator [Ardenticatenia bacterium]|nr:MAG: Crp/Fnr family transcriptional regulator [Ardenticatenia bacterium]